MTPLRGVLPVIVRNTTHNHKYNQSSFRIRIQKLFQKKSRLIEDREKLHITWTCSLHADCTIVHTVIYRSNAPAGMLQRAFLLVCEAPGCTLGMLHSSSLVSPLTLIPHLMLLTYSDQIPHGNPSREETISGVDQAPKFL